MLWKGFQKPKRLSISSEDQEQHFGQFTAQPFERGFGTTIGNALRRVLLSSIEGAAVTAVRIEGILHEFSPIPGVVEGATDIILNLKPVSFRLSGEGPKTLYLESESPGVVTSADIQTDGDVEILDKTVYLAQRTLMMLGLMSASARSTGLREATGQRICASRAGCSPT